MSASTTRRILILAPTTTYRLEPFLEAARRLGIDVVVGDNRCHVLAELRSDRSLFMEFNRPEEALKVVLDFVRKNPVDAIIPVDDRNVKLAAQASAALGLPHNHPDAADAARNKFLMRERFSQAGLRSPAYARYRLDDPVEQVAAAVSYPCVLKPLHLQGSRGVIRADNPAAFALAFCRLKAILESPEVRVYREPEAEEYLVERFVPGFEVALEGLLMRSKLHLLALFDKPDPLDGPFFEETYYITPSRLSETVQAQVFECATRGAQALGLHEGPIHAELRINPEGVWMIELAARSIGGHCSRILKYGLGRSLEELILQHALGQPDTPPERESRAAGVLMIPIPCGGFLKGVEGIEKALAVPGVDEVKITIRLGQWVTPLPEGASYLGFLFARGDSPAEVERSLREAHTCLTFKIAKDPLSLHAETEPKSCADSDVCSDTNAL